MIIDFNNKDILISGATGNLGKSMVNFFSKYNSYIHATSTNYNFVKKFNFGLIIKPVPPNCQS